jgi:cytochrome b6-f complex iron-sulfur subunit
MQQTTRRVFCATLCQAAACAATAGARQNAALPIVRGQVEGDRVTVRIASTALAEVGGRARVASTTGAFLVARVGEREFVALTGTCSHESCQITDADVEAYVCPCHESKFSSQGNVLRGPAELPLQEYVTAFTGGVLTITV